LLFFAGSLKAHLADLVSAPRRYHDCIATGLCFRGWLAAFISTSGRES